MNQSKKCFLKVFNPKFPLIFSQEQPKTFVSNEIKHFMKLVYLFQLKMDSKIVIVKIDFKNVYNVPLHDPNMIKKIRKKNL